MNRKGGHNMPHSIWITILSLIFYLANLGGLFSLPLTPPPVSSSIVAGTQAKVQVPRTTLKSGPGMEHGSLTPIVEGDRVTLLEKEGPWYRVQLDTQETGWVLESVLNLAKQAKQKNKVVAGYYLPIESSYHSMVQNGNHMTHGIPWSFFLNSYGGLELQWDPKALSEMLAFAGNQELKTYALIHNYFNYDFDQRVVTAFLGSKVAKERAIDEIVAAVLEWGMDGVHLDLEKVREEDEESLTEFVKSLGFALRSQERELTMAVPPKTNSNSHGAYNYEELGNHVDKMVLMTYNQHHIQGEPGPIASVLWVEEVVKYALGLVPKERILLGIAAYGYDWPPSGIAKSVTFTEAMELAALEGALLKWDPAHKVPFFEYGDKRQVWFENRYSLRYKVELVEKYQLAGIALWRLGQEDPGIWPVLRELL